MVGYTLYYIYIYIFAVHVVTVLLCGVCSFDCHWTTGTTTRIHPSPQSLAREECHYGRTHSVTWDIPGNCPHLVPCSLVLIIIIVTSGNRHYLLALLFVGVYRSSSRSHTMVQYRIRGGTSTLKVKPTIQMPFCCCWISIPQLL